MRIKKIYNDNKSKKVGQQCVCPSCGSIFVKTSYQQVFCKFRPKTVCKDKYWNTVDPSKRNNTTRISPASAAYMEERRERSERSIFFDDDQGWDAHKDSF